MNDEELEKIYSEMRTGDIILLSGKGNLFSRLVEFFTWSDYSHIGIVLKDPKEIDSSLNGLYFWESGTETVPDSIENKKLFGVQMVPLIDKIKKYNGKVIYRKLNWDRPNFYKNMICNGIYKKVKNKPYDINPRDFLEAEIDKDLGNPRNNTAFFCSAFVAYIYTKFGLLPKDTKWTLYSPKDFGSWYMNKLESGAYLEKEVQLDFS